MFFDAALGTVTNEVVTIQWKRAVGLFCLSFFVQGMDLKIMFNPVCSALPFGNEINC